jgi:glyoxylase-like metal-dependent hydrolase (beta-lactamase superfamily II)/8-oxo-dGTP pyrophosphatase MutT (NUDIX family)
LAKASAPAHPVLASALVLRAASGRVLVSKRSEAAPFLGGFVAFVGGRVEDADADLAEALFGRRDEAAAVWTAALRELLEETGLHLTPAGLVGGLDRSTPLADAAAAHGIAPIERGRPAGRWITPDYAKIRFDTCFLLVDVPAPSEAQPDPRELAWARFLTPEAVLDAHRRLDILLPRPTKDQLEALRDHPGEGAAEILASLTGDDGQAPAPGIGARPASPGFEPLHGVWQLPLRTPTLPPATHTNCYVLGHERAVVVDPATYEADEREKLGALLDALAAGGTRFEAVILTHHHRDHVGSARWTADRLGVPVLAHPLTEALLEGHIEIDGHLDEGDVLELGVDATGEPFRLEILHTPGHAAGHLVLLDARRGERCMIVGDMVAAVGSIIVDPDEGDMAEYIRQLERLARRPAGVVCPAHGPPIAAGRRKLEAYIAHRLEREAKVLGALRSHAGAASPEDLLPGAYADTPRFAWPLAARACLAHLEKLEAEGRARRHPGSRFTAA